MPGPPEDWAEVGERLLAGDPGALARVNRLVTGVLTQLRAYDFRDAWDDVRQEVLAAVVANARAGRLRDPAAFVAYVRAIARNKVMDHLKAHLRCRPGETIPWEDVAESLPAVEDDPRVREVWAAAETLYGPADATAVSRRDCDGEIRCVELRDREAGAERRGARHVRAYPGPTKLLRCAPRRRLPSRGAMAGRRTSVARRRIVRARWRQAGKRCRPPAWRGHASWQR